VHSWGGKVIGTVATSKHALRAVNDGVDALAVTGHEAAAHGGEIGSMIIIPAIAGRVKVPVIAAGGFYNGRGLMAALALGAEAISMGTRFAMTKESPVHPYYKQLMVAASEEDTLITDRWDGLPGRLFKTNAALDLIKRHGLGIDTVRSTLRMKRELNLSWGELIAGSLRMKKVEQLSLGKMVAIPVGFSMLKRAIYEGADGIMLAGQSVGMIDSVLTCKEVIDQTVSEACEIKERLCKL
jgi:enoyl-[acyl-carrier protein] reductase II